MIVLRTNGVTAIACDLALVFVGMVARIHAYASDLLLGTYHTAGNFG